MSDQRKMQLLSMGIDRLADWCMTVESLNAEKAARITELEAENEKLRDQIIQLDLMLSECMGIGNPNKEEK